FRSIRRLNPAVGLTHCVLPWSPMAFHSALLHFISLVRACFPSLGSFKQVHCFTLPSRPVSEVCSWLAPRLFRENFSLRFSRVLSAGLSLGSSALRSFRLSPAFFTTTASADFCSGSRPTDLP